MGGVLCDIRISNQGRLATLAVSLYIPERRFRASKCPGMSYNIVENCGNARKFTSDANGKNAFPPSPFHAPRVGNAFVMISRRSFSHLALSPEMRTWARRKTSESSARRKRKSCKKLHAYFMHILFPYQFVIISLCIKIWFKNIAFRILVPTARGGEWKFPLSLIN